MFLLSLQRRLKKLLAFEMRSYRRIKMCWKDKVSNSTVRDRELRHCTIVDVVKQRKLQLFGHICRMNDQRLMKILMLEMVEGNRPRGRPARRWSGDIRDWCVVYVHYQRLFNWRLTERSILELWHCSPSCKNCRISPTAKCSYNYSKYM